MVLLSVLRHWHFRERMLTREITRRTGLSRNTVRKYIASGELEPCYKRPESLSKLDDYEQILNSWLHRETKRPRKQRLTAKHLHQDLMLLGYADSYDRVAAFARRWKRSNSIDTQAFVPLWFSPSEAFQFDWNEDHAMIAGLNTKVQVAHTKLSFSLAFNGSGLFFTNSRDVI